jgi:thioredoxin 1
MSIAKNIEALTDANFGELALRSPTPVLLEFGAAWCPPCRAMEPHVEAVAAAFAGRLRVAACDTDANRAAALHFGVQSLPTFVVVKDGKVVDRAVGAMPRQRLEAMIRRSVG